MWQIFNGGDDSFKYQVCLSVLDCMGICPVTIGTVYSCLIIGFLSQFLDVHFAGIDTESMN